MMLNYSFHENIDDNETLTLFDTASSARTRAGAKRESSDIRIISEKIRIPRRAPENFHRARLFDLLTKQAEQFTTSLVTGRAGTGKSALAIEFAENYERVAWYRVDQTDADWQTFAQYFISSFPDVLRETDFNFPARDGAAKPETNVLSFLETLFSALEKAAEDAPCLIVLDDFHNVFDADWFETFFSGLLSFQIPTVHILLLARSKPPFPLWRLRSKQKLGVIEENLLLFTTGELEEFLKSKKISTDKIKRIHKTSFGRISKILELLLGENSLSKAAL